MTHPEAVYRCDKIKRFQPPQNETFVSAHPCLMSAMREANRLARLDRAHSYVVGYAPCAS